MGSSIINGFVTLHLLSATITFLPLEKVGVAALPFSPIYEFPEIPQPPSLGQWKGMHGYARFHANDSLIGREIPCSRDEKICLRHNLMFDPKTDKCQPLGENTRDCALRASRREFEHGSGHIVGICQKYDDPCWYSGYRMAYDGLCYDRAIVTDTICGCELAPTLHFLGGVECNCSPIELRNVTQPEEEGRCRIPDFRNPRPAVVNNHNQTLKTHGVFGLTLQNCSQDHRRCFSKGKVWVSSANGCYSLLKKGPCDEDFVVVLDGRATEEDRAEAVCAHVRGGCPHGQNRMEFDSQCYDDREIAIMAPGVVLFNVYGVHEVLGYGESVDYRVGIEENEDTCEVYFDHFWPLIDYRERPGKPLCEEADMSLCSLYEVVETPPDAYSSAQHAVQ